MGTRDLKDVELGERVSGLELEKCLNFDLFEGELG